MQSFENNARIATPAGRGFIVGAPRSGTTLLINLIAAHPEIAPVYETGYIRNLLQLCDWKARMTSRSRGNLIYALAGRRLRTWRLRKKAKTFVKKVLLHYRSSARKRSGKTEDEFFPFGNSCIEYTFCELVHESDRFLRAFERIGGESGEPSVLGRHYLDRLFAKHCAKMGRPFWVNKTPDLVRQVDLLHQMYPECGIVHIVRDGRDVSLSTVSRRFGPNSVREAARRWKQMILSGRKMGRNHKYLELRYEGLISDPAPHMESVFEFLGVDARLAVDLPGMRIYKHRENVWRDSMAKKDRLDFAEEAGDLLIELGYEKDNDWVK